MAARAARVGDVTSHGTPLSPGPGSTTVFIEGRPAWRAGVDRHACPHSTGAAAHGGGVVEVGSATVFIGGHPAARAGDVVMEAGGPNAIIAGASTVLIG